MIKLLPLIRHYLVYHRGKTVTLTICLTTALYLPLTVHSLVEMLQAEMVRRAEATPIVIGPEGSRFDLVLHALYFHTDAPGTIPRKAAAGVGDSGYAAAVPLFVRYRARGHPIVGTTLEYFPLRGLDIGRGHLPTLLGDCVVGWQVAQRLGLSPGDRLLSDPENVFDLGGAYPLDMRVTGILDPAHSPDDHAVFVDLKTAWIIEGIGHGHDDLDETADPESVLRTEEDRTVASPALRTHTRITPENLASFHFHGDPGEFPLTAILAFPHDPRSGTLLLGRYVGEESRLQALRPREVTEELLGMVVQLKRFFDFHHALMFAVVGLFVALVMLLSLRLRKREAETLFHLGCSRGTLFTLQAAELLILLTVSAVLAGAASWTTVQAARTWVQTLSG